MTTAHKIQHFSILLKMKKMKRKKINEKECGEERLRLGRVGMRGTCPFALLSFCAKLRLSLAAFLAAFGVDPTEPLAGPNNMG